MAVRTDFEEQLIAEMRAHGGEVTSGPLAGHPLLVMTSRGGRSGQPRRVILTYSRDGEDYVVAGTAGGSPTHPAWVHNVRANPSVQVEIRTRVVPATVTEAHGAERQRLWDQHVAALPWFAEYPPKAKREIPVLRIRPMASVED